MNGSFVALAAAILRGFLRDRAAVFFALIFPLMFLVLFGGLLGDQSQSKADVIEVGRVSVLDDLPAEQRDGLRQVFNLSHSDDLAGSLAKVRKGDADAVVQMKGDRLVAHYTETDRVKAGLTQGALASLIDAANVAATGQSPRYSLSVQRVEDDSLSTIQFVTPGLLGWAVAMSAAFGAAATLQGWRNSKLLRRLQLAPVSTGTVVGARVGVTIAVALVQLAVFLAVGAGLFGLVLTGSWWASIPLLVVGTLCFMAIGLLAGAITTTTEGAVNAANFMVLPMAFLSGSFFPLDATPGWIQAVAHVLPLWHLNNGMLDVMVRGEGPGAVLAPMAVLAGFAVVVTGLAARLFRWETV
ncbi:MAG: ABC transporter permease [Nocardioides sp.]|uniref:ABC transporter permease n=1 Tax=Nocardioides sp. TaxID=35761 RepID=UPI0039E7271C